MAAALSSRGHQVALTSDGSKGIKLLNEEQFDLVITDLIVPASEDAETILQWGEVPKGLRILAPSGLAKPFSTGELIDAVDRALALA